MTALQINKPDNWQRASDTRWACRYLSLDVIASTFDSILATPDSIAEGNDKPKAIEVTGLLHQIHSFKFISCPVIFLRIMGITKSLSHQLKSREIDLALAADLVISTSDSLKTLRNNDAWIRCISTSQRWLLFITLKSRY